jgi:hypothetical protein
VCHQLFDTSFHISRTLLLHSSEPISSAGSLSIGNLPLSISSMAKSMKCCRAAAQSRRWPTAMTLESNLVDLVRHAKDFDDRTGFTYSILDGDDVIGCLYIYQSKTADALVTSWVRAARADMDSITAQAIADWIQTAWPFSTIETER